jgi:hypothetical protein
MERDNMPGNVRRDAADELRHLAQSVVGIIEARDYQSHYFQPKAEPVNFLNTVQDGLQAGAKLVIPPVIETF